MRFWIYAFSAGAVLSAQTAPAPLPHIKKDFTGFFNIQPVQKTVFHVPAPAADGICSAAMPRAAVSKNVDPKMAVRVEGYTMPQATMPAPECKSAAATARPADPSPAPSVPRVLPAPIRPNPFGGVVLYPKP